MPEQLSGMFTSRSLDFSLHRFLHPQENSCPSENSRRCKVLVSVPTQCVFSRFWNWRYKLGHQGCFPTENPRDSSQEERIFELHTAGLLAHPCPFHKAPCLGKQNGVNCQSSFSLSPFLNPLHSDLIVCPVSYDFHFPCSKAVYLNMLIEFLPIVTGWCCHSDICFSFSLFSLMKSLWSCPQTLQVMSQFSTYHTLTEFTHLELTTLTSGE